MIEFLAVVVVILILSPLALAAITGFVIFMLAILSPLALLFRFTSPD